MPLWSVGTDSDAVAVLVDTARVLQRERRTRDATVDVTTPKTPVYLVVATHAPSPSHQGLPGGFDHRAIPAMMGPNGWSTWTHFWRPTILDLNPVSNPSTNMAGRLGRWISNQHLDRDSPLGTALVSHYEAIVRFHAAADLGASSLAAKASHLFSIVRQRSNGDGCILWLACNGYDITHTG
jgi:hypothetical protein